MRRRPALSVASISALVMAGLAVPLAGAPTARADAPRTATVVGSLQDELGCSGDWQPDCTATDLALQPGTTTYAAEFRLPAGSYELKVAINHSWDESYGQGSGNVPLVMADRFANGDTTNDRGGLTGGPLATGFDPTNEGFYHGGDLKGLTGKLDYIKGLGTTAIWLTPSFKNRPVQGSGSDASAGYHGYWITDFTQIDPHLGTNGDMRTLISAAHAKGMKVYFDIITNHTADVISYDGGKYTYVNKATKPYKDARGKAFDDAAVAGKPACTGGATAPDCFPAMSPATSFPYVPKVADADK